MFTLSAATDGDGKGETLILLFVSDPPPLPPALLLLLLEDLFATAAVGDVAAGPAGLFSTTAPAPAPTSSTPRSTSGLPGTGSLRNLEKSLRTRWS